MHTASRMKPPKRASKITLTTETVRRLGADHLALVAGGEDSTSGYGSCKYNATNLCNPAPDSWDWVRTIL